MTIMRHNLNYKQRIILISLKSKFQFNKRLFFSVLVSLIHPAHNLLNILEQ